MAILLKEFPVLNNVLVYIYIYIMPNAKLYFQIMIRNNLRNVKAKRKQKKKYQHTRNCIPKCL